MQAWTHLKTLWKKHRLLNPEYSFLFDVPPQDEVVCFDCETTGLNPRKDRILSLSAIRIKGREVLASRALNLTLRPESEVSESSIKVHWLRETDLEDGVSEREAMERFLHFIGPRPLVGYYLEFDVAMVNRAIKPWLGISLPNPQIEVSELYYDYKETPIPQKMIDLSFQAILKDLNLPEMGQHDAFQDALMTALMYVKLKTLA